MSEFDLGRHEAMIESLDSRMSGVEHTVTSMDKKLDSVLLHLAEKRGERKVLVLVASAAATVVSILIAIGKALLGH